MRLEARLMRASISAQRNVRPPEISHHLFTLFFLYTHSKRSCREATAPVFCFFLPSFGSHSLLEHSSRRTHEPKKQCVNVTKKKERKETVPAETKIGAFKRASSLTRASRRPSRGIIMMQPNDERGRWPAHDSQREVADVKLCRP